MNVIQALPEALASALASLWIFSRVIGEHFYWLYPARLGLFAVLMAAYYAIPKAKFQNWILLVLGVDVAAFVSPMFCLILATTVFLDWVLAVRIQRTESVGMKNLLLGVSVASNLGLVVSMLTPKFHPIAVDALRQVGAPELVSHHLSRYFLSGFHVFLIFSKLSLVLDAYRGRLGTSIKLLDSLVFGMLFTRYIGTPIDRARDTLPQLAKERRWKKERLEDSAWLLLTGLVEISFHHELSSVIYPIFDGTPRGVVLIAGSWLLMIDSWLAFSGLVNIARAFGTFAGIRLPENFDAPLLGTNIAEFWRRWNMSVMSWLNEEIFSRVAFRLRAWGMGGTVVACLVTFIFCGIAHEISIQSTIWWTIQAVIILGYFFFKRRIRKFAKSQGNPRWFTFLGWLVTFTLVSFIFALGAFPEIWSLGGLARACWGSPVWPLIAGVQWLRVGGITIVALFLHTMPHYRGGDLWMLNLPRLKKIGLALSLVILMFASDWTFPVN